MNAFKQNRNENNCNVANAVETKRSKLVEMGQIDKAQ